jgi:ADP-heptose:LPS heptosyltransferase
VSVIIRQIALFIRRRSEQKQVQTVLRQFDEWRLFIDAMPKFAVQPKSIAIVRLDDIGDYLLWRNVLALYKQAPAYAGYSITLIGNIVWKSIFEAYDAAAVDATIWVDKQQYFSSQTYRTTLWEHVRQQGFEKIICPARTRPLLLDDLIACASAAQHKLAAHNTFAAQDWNACSDKLYNELHTVSHTQSHEFFYNKAFTEKATAFSASITDLSLPIPTSVQNPKQIICFIGASAQSKQWSIAYWIRLVQLLQQQGWQALLSGGKNESPLAAEIIAATKVASIVGQTNLIETLAVIAQSAAVITGDTMAAHAAVALHKPSVILANGVNAQRFVAYQEAGFEGVTTIYTKQYKGHQHEPFYRAVTKDMQSIQPEQIMEALSRLM